MSVKKEKITVLRRIFYNKKTIVLSLIVLLIIAVVGVSYALWQVVLQQTDTNVITTGCLKLTLTEETDAINLENVTPISDTDGKTLLPYTFTLENICAVDTNYVINLETIAASTKDKILADNHVKAHLISNTDQLFLDKLLAKHINEEKVITDATSAYKLYQGTLGNKEKKQFSLRLWMSEDTEAIDEVMNAIWSGKITVTATYTPPIDMKNVMIKIDKQSSYLGAGMYEFHNLTYTQNQKYSLSKIIYEKSLNLHTDAVEIVDFSEGQDESVMAYYVKDNEGDTHTLYIQADGKIKVNPIGSYYFTYEELFGEIQPIEFEGIENLDTSLVTDMSYMFYQFYPNSVDISNFNTSKVTSMSKMFFNCSRLTSLNLSNFNTINVTDMSNMFFNCSRLTSLNLSNFDTSQVTTMYSMFDGCRSLISLDLSSFDTSNVTNMARMFSDCRSLTNLDVSNFNTSNVANMGSMFSNCSRLTSLDLSSFNTEQVTNMDYMFRDCTNLVNITYGQNFIYANEASVNDMFSSCPSNKPIHASWSGIV